MVFLLFVQLEDGKEGLRRHLHGAERAHFLFALLLLFQQLFLSADIAAVALGENVLAHGLDGLARDDAPADGRLNGISKSWRGILSLSFSHSFLARA